MPRSSVAMNFFLTFLPFQEIFGSFLDWHVPYNDLAQNQKHNDFWTDQIELEMT